MSLRTRKDVGTTMTDERSSDADPAGGPRNTAADAQTPEGRADQDIEPAVDSDPHLDGNVESDDDEQTEVTQTDGTDPVAATPKSGREWSRTITFIILPMVALTLAVVAGFLKWEDGSLRASQVARVQSLQAAKDTTVALLSYQPDTAEKQLGAAEQLLTGSFKNDFHDLITKVVIPGSKQQRISTVATVPAAASVSASADGAVVLLYVNQSTMIGSTPPTDLQSTVRVTLDKVDGRWLISGFTPE
jgi:Mce-associated membrane protein